MLAYRALLRELLEAPDGASEAQPATEATPPVSPTPPLTPPVPPCAAATSGLDDADETEAETGRYPAPGRRPERPRRPGEPRPPARRSFRGPGDKKGMTAMSLDFDRSPDGEPTPPAAQPPVPAQQAPATTDQERPAAPSFTPKHAAGEPMDDELTGDEPTASGSALAEPAAGEPEADELADDEPVTAGSDEPIGSPCARRARARASELPSWQTTSRRAGAASDVLAEPEPARRRCPRLPSPCPPMPRRPKPRRITRARPRPGTPRQPTAPRPAIRQVSSPSAGLDGPLLSDADELRTSWPRIQAAFVDDPREAVADAAGLVEHAAQALTSALRQRQRQLRAVWDRDGMPDGVRVRRQRRHRARCRGPRRGPAGGG